jgi:ribonuclease Z
MSLSITLLGTGCPVVHPERRGAAQLIEADGTKLLVDCGSGVTQQLIAAGTRGPEIDALLITHYHSDHLVDFYQLIVSSWHQGRDRPWQIHAPATVITHLEKQMDAWRDERELRIAFEKRPNGASAFELECHVLTDGAFGIWPGLEVEAIPVHHEPIHPAYGFRFTAGQTTIVMSGDTKPCQAIQDAARGVDLLVHEVFIHDQMPLTTGMRTSETIRSVASYHTLPKDLATLAARANCAALALTHFVPPVFDRQKLIEQMAARFSGPIIVGEDLMRIEAHSRSIAWRGARLRY